MNEEEEMMPPQDNFDVGEQFDPDDAPSVIAVVKAFSQGFTVDDGELRPYEDPENREFFDSVDKSEVPDELLERGVTEVNYEDYRHESYYANDETEITYEDAQSEIYVDLPQDAHGEFRDDAELSQLSEAINNMNTVIFP